MDKYSNDSELLMWVIALVLTGFMFGYDGAGGGFGTTLTVPPQAQSRA
jgi:hypothetical protein